MSGILLIGLVAVVWLVVLAPLLLRGQKPIRKAGEAFDETRVILKGGSKVPTRRRPRLGSQDPSDVVDEARSDDDYQLVDSPSKPKKRQEDVEVEHEEEKLVELVESKLEAAPAEQELQEWDEADHYPLDDSYTAPVDYLHPDERARASAEFNSDSDQPAVQEASNYIDTDEELTEEDVEFAERRRGRGYYDPQADQEFAASQYVRRQRTLIGLGIVVVVAVIVGFIFGGWAWAVPVVAIAISAFYLVALRNQVRAENELRARRIRRLRRSRMGVKNSEDFPQRLRRPGAVVLEIDDESPDFVGLDTVEHAELSFYEPHHDDDTRRAG